MLLNRAQRAKVPLLILLISMKPEDKNGFSNSKFVMVCVVSGKIDFPDYRVFFISVIII